MPIQLNKLNLLKLSTCLVFMLCISDVYGNDTRRLDINIAAAAELNELPRVQTLLKQKHNPDDAQPDGMTPLLWAAYHDNVKMAGVLIQAGADVAAKNRYGVNALSLACKNGNGELVSLLLEKGADPNTTLNGGETALMTASRTGRLSAVNALLKHGAKVDAKERRGQTALMWAAAEGHTPVVEALIKAGADYKKPLRTGFTPLSFAVRNGHIGVTRLLIANGVDVNRAMSEARGGRNKPVKHTSPLMLAMENGNFELAVELLKAGADPNDERTGFTPLHAMSWIRKPEIGDNDSGTPPPPVTGKISSLQFVRILVEHGADVNFQKTDNGGGRRKISIKGTTPFLCAAGTADVDLMKTLLDLGADPKLKNRTGHTALMMAAGIGEGAEADGAGTKAEHFAAVKFLIDLGADVNAVDRNGETAMHGAAYKSLPKVAKLLTDNGADIRIWSKKSKQGRTPLSIAQGFRPGNFKPSYETVQAIEKIMLAKGVKPPPPPKRKEDGWKD